MFDEGMQGKEGPNYPTPFDSLEGEGVSEHILGLQVVELADCVFVDLSHE